MSVKGDTQQQASYLTDRHIQDRRLHDLPAGVGDLIRVESDLPGVRPKTARILETFGLRGPVRFRVRWDDESESMYYPSRAVNVIARAPQTDAPLPAFSRGRS